MNKLSFVRGWRKRAASELERKTHVLFYNEPDPVTEKAKRLW
jgi:hypothetical protein